MDERLTDIGVDLPRQRAEPRLDRVDAFADHGEAETVHDPLDRPQLFLDAGGVDIATR